MIVKKEFRRRWPLVVVHVVVAGSLFSLGCNSKQGFEPNYGSGMQAIHSVLSATREFFEANHHYPFHRAGLQDLERYGLPAPVAPLVHYLDTNVTPGVVISLDTICVIASHPTKDAKDRKYRYVGLVSGEVKLLPESEAKLGAKFPPPGN